MPLPTLASHILIELFLCLCRTGNTGSATCGREKHRAPPRYPAVAVVEVVPLAEVPLAHQALVGTEVTLRAIAVVPLALEKDTRRLVGECIFIVRILPPAL